MTTSKEESSNTNANDELPSGSTATPSSPSLSLTEVAKDFIRLKSSSIVKTDNLCPSGKIDDNQVSTEVVSHLYL